MGYNGKLPGKDELANLIIGALRQDKQDVIVDAKIQAEIDQPSFKAAEEKIDSLSKPRDVKVNTSKAEQQIKNLMEPLRDVERTIKGLGSSGANFSSIHNAINGYEKLKAAVSAASKEIDANNQELKDAQKIIRNVDNVMSNLNMTVEKAPKKKRTRKNNGTTTVVFENASGSTHTEKDTLLTDTQKEVSKTVANRISQNSSIKGIKNLEQAAISTAQALDEMYDAGIKDTEKYITLQYKLSKIIDKMADSYGGVRRSGAKDKTELQSWIFDRIQQVTGKNIFDNSVMENLLGDSKFSLFNKSLSGLGMQDIADLLVAGDKHGDWTDSVVNDVEHAAETTEKALSDVEAAIKRLNELSQDPWTMKKESEVNAIYEERLTIIKKIGEEKLKAFNNNEYEGILEVNDWYSSRLDGFKESRDDDIYNKLGDQYAYYNDRIDSTEDLESLLENRIRLMGDIYFNEEESYKTEEEINSAIRNRIALMKELEPLVASGAMNKDELEDVVFERGTLDEKRSRLEGVFQDLFNLDEGELDEAQMILDKYEKILVTTASGKKLKLGPDMSEADYKAFMKADVEKVKSVEFVRKAIEQQVQQQQQLNDEIAETSEQSTTPQETKNVQKLTSSYEGLADAVERYVDASKKLWDAYDKNEDYAKHAEARNAAIADIVSLFPSDYSTGIAANLTKSGYSMMLQDQAMSRTYANSGAEKMLRAVEANLGQSKDQLRIAQETASEQESSVESIEQIKSETGRALKHFDLMHMSAKKLNGEMRSIKDEVRQIWSTGEDIGQRISLVYKNGAKSVINGDWMTSFDENGNVVDKKTLSELSKSAMEKVLTNVVYASSIGYDKKHDTQVGNLNSYIVGSSEDRLLRLSNEDYLHVYYAQVEKIHGVVRDTTDELEIQVGMYEQMVDNQSSTIKLYKQKHALESKIFGLIKKMEDKSNPYYSWENHTVAGELARRKQTLKYYQEQEGLMRELDQAYDDYANLQVMPQDKADFENTAYAAGYRPSQMAENFKDITEGMRLMNAEIPKFTERLNKKLVETGELLGRLQTEYGDRFNKIFGKSMESFGNVLNSDNAEMMYEVLTSKEQEYTQEIQKRIQTVAEFTKENGDLLSQYSNTDMWKDVELKLGEICTKIFEDGLSLEDATNQLAEFAKTLEVPVQPQIAPKAVETEVQENIYRDPIEVPVQPVVESGAVEESVYKYPYSEEQMKSFLKGTDLEGYLKSVNIKPAEREEVKSEFYKLASIVAELTEATSGEGFYNQDDEERLATEMTEQLGKVTNMISTYGKEQREKDRVYDDLFQKIKNGEIKIGYNDADKADFGNDWDHIFSVLGNGYGVLNKNSKRANGQWLDLKKLTGDLLKDEDQDINQTRAILELLMRAVEEGQDKKQYDYIDLDPSGIEKDIAAKASIVSHNVEQQIEQERRLADEAEKTAEEKQKQALAAASAASKTKDQANAEKSIKGGNKDKKVSVPFYEGSVEDDYLKQLREAKDNDTEFFKFSGVYDVNELEAQIRDTAQKVLGSEMSIDSVTIQDNTAIIRLYNEELGITAAQMYRLEKASEDATEAQLEFISGTQKYSPRAEKKYGEAQQRKVDQNDRWLIAQMSRLNTQERAFKHSNKKLKDNTPLVSIDETTLEKDVDQTIDNLAAHIRQRITSAVGAELSEDFKNELLNDMRVLENEIKIAQYDQYAAQEMQPAQVEEARKDLINLLDTLEARAQRKNVFGQVSDDIDNLRKKLTDKTFNGYAEKGADISSIAKEIKNVQGKVTAEIAVQETQIAKYREILALTKKINEARLEYTKASESGEDTSFQVKQIKALNEQRKALMGQTKLTAEQELELEREQHDYLQDRKKLLNDISAQRQRDAVQEAQHSKKLYDDAEKAQDKLYKAKKELVTLENQSGTNTADYQIAKRKTEELEAQYDTAVSLLDNEDQYYAIEERRLRLEREIEASIDDQLNAQQKKLAAEEASQAAARNKQTKQETDWYDKELESEVNGLLTTRESILKRIYDLEVQKSKATTKAATDEADARIKSAQNELDAINYQIEAYGELAKQKLAAQDSKFDNKYGRKEDSDAISAKEQEAKNLQKALLEVDSLTKKVLEQINTWEADKSIEFLPDSLKSEIKQFQASLSSLDENSDLDKIGKQWNDIVAKTNEAIKANKEYTNAHLKNEFQNNYHHIGGRTTDDDIELSAMRDFYNQQEAEAQQSNDNIKSIYDRLLNTVKEIDSLNTKINSLTFTDKGSGLYMHTLDGLQKQKYALFEELSNIDKEIKTKLNLGSFGADPSTVNFFDGSDISSIFGEESFIKFFEDARVQTALTEEEIQNFINVVNKADDNKFNFIAKLTQQIQPAIEKVQALTKLIQEGIIDINSDAGKGILSIGENFANQMMSFKEDPSAFKAMDLMKFANDVTPYINALDAAAKKEREYFANKKQYTASTTMSSMAEDAEKAANKIGSAQKELTDIANDFAKQSGASGAIVTKFTEGADGIARLDFSVLDQGTNSLRKFSVEMGNVTKGTYITENTVDSFVTKAQAAGKQLDAVSDLINRLKATDGIDMGHSSIVNLVEAQRQLNEELSKGDSADETKLSQYIREAKLCQAEAEKFYKKHMQLQGIIDSDRGAKEFGVNLDGDVYGQIREHVNALAGELGGANVKIGKFNETTGKLKFTMEAADGTLQEYTAHLDEHGKRIVMHKTGVQELASKWDKLKNSLSGLCKQFMTAFAGANIFYRALSELRKGYQYVKEIDLAMTELRKVTDETEASYKNFLVTASKTSSEIGSTVSDFTEATSEFARLGYTMDESAEMAKTAIVYKNVADGLDTVEESTESIISTMKAFGIESDDTMSIIDRFNEVGKYIAQVT